MRRAILTAGLGGATLCAFGVSAAATIDMAAGAGMTGLVRPALVGVLELLSLGCAWGWVTTEDTKLKREFAIIMAVASGVSAVAGFLAFSLVGLVAPPGLLAAVHVTSRMWTTPNQAPVAGPVREPTAVQTEPDQTEPELVVQERGQTELGPGVQGSLQPVQVDRSAAESEPVLGDTVNRGAAGWTDEAILRDLRSRGETAIRQRAIRDHYKVGPAKADRVLEKLRTSRLEAVS